MTAIKEQTFVDHGLSNECDLKTFLDHGSEISFMEVVHDDLKLFDHPGDYSSSVWGALFTIDKGEIVVFGLKDRSAMFLV